MNIIINLAFILVVYKRELDNMSAGAQHNFLLFLLDKDEHKLKMLPVNGKI